MPKRQIRGAKRMTRPVPKSRQEFRWFLPLQTRWSDNDQYGHANNVVYYSYFDTVVNVWLIEKAGLKPLQSAWIGLVVETQCAYFASVGFPEALEVGLRVIHKGRSSVRYEIGVFQKDANETAALGAFTHVYVDAQTRRPAPLAPELDAALTALL
jgi:acyl-CoA thioester hydrolase